MPIKMKIGFILLASLLMLPTSSFAQDQAPPTQVTPEENINIILNNLGHINYEKIKENFPAIRAQIESLSPPEDKDLFLAKLFLIYPGDKDENLPRALSLAESYLKNHPKSFQAYCVLAGAYQRQISINSLFISGGPSKWKNKEDIKLRQQALENADKSLAIQENSEAYSIKGQLSEGDEQIKLLEKATDLNPLDSDAWWQLTNELINRKRYDETITKLLLWDQNEKFVESSIEIRIRLANAYREKKEYDQAIEWLEKALSIRNQSGRDGSETIFSGIDEIYLAFANTYLEAKNNAAAETYFKKYLELKPKSTDARFKLAKLYHDIGEKDKAIVQYEQTLGYDENNAASIYNLALLYKDSDKDKSKELFTKYIKLQMEDDSDYSKTWVENAKTNLRELGVYDYPKSKKELKEQKFQVVKTFSIIAIIVSIFGFIVFLGWKFKGVTKWIILSSMVLAMVFISLNEAGSYQPSVGKAFLYFVPVITIGGFLLYIFRKK